MTAFVGGLDQVVRPFQSPLIAPSTREPADQSSGSDEVLLQVGKEGQVKTFNGSISASQSSFVGQVVKEASRKTVSKRVENPDDPSQFVEVANTTRRKTQSGTGQQYTEATRHYKNEKEPGEVP